jgi:PadR family transcriptional regulator PadR
MASVLGMLEQAVLLAIVRLGDGAYGRAILKEVQRRLRPDTAAGAVHATLDRLERKGLLASHLGTGSAERAGRARRYYALRARGVRALNETKQTMDALWRGQKLPEKA